MLVPQTEMSPKSQLNRTSASWPPTHTYNPTAPSLPALSSAFATASHPGAGTQRGRAHSEGPTSLSACRSGEQVAETRFPHSGTVPSLKNRLGDSSRSSLRKRCSMTLGGHLVGTRRQSPLVPFFLLCNHGSCHGNHTLLIVPFDSQLLESLTELPRVDF